MKESASPKGGVLFSEDLIIRQAEAHRFGCAKPFVRLHDHVKRLCPTPFRDPLTKLQDGFMEQNIDLLPTGALGATLLRFILAGFWIAHWWFKVGYCGMPATEAFFKQQGLPTWLAWFVLRFEVVIASGLILGIGVPLLCLISLPILLASMWIYRKNGFYFVGGGIEFPALWAGAQITQAFLGAGAFRTPLPAWLPAALRILL
jgi:uncharacterized membrane protein YphA (DoxX/SURF4 family)